MTQKTIKTNIDEIYSKPPEKNYATNKSGICLIDNMWSLDILDIEDFGPESKIADRSDRYVVVVIDNVCKFGSTTPLKNKNAQTIKDFRKWSYNLKKKIELERIR